MFLTNVVIPGDNYFSISYHGSVTNMIQLNSNGFVTFPQGLLALNPGFASGNIRFQGNILYLFSGSTGFQIYDAATNPALFVNSAGSIGIGTTTIGASAKMQIDSTTKGFLIPRMTTTQRNAISSPATSLLIFNTTTNFYEYFDSVSWNPVNVSAYNYAFSYDATTQALAIAGTNIVFATDSLLNGFTRPTADQFVCHEAGTYSVSFAATLRKPNGVPSETVDLFLTKNAVEITGTRITNSVSANNINFAASKTCLVSLVVNDILRLRGDTSGANAVLSNNGGISVSMKIERIL